MSRRWCISKIQFKWLFSEIDDVETGLLIEVWDKGMLWDKAIGYFWTPLQSLQFSAVVRTIFLKKCPPKHNHTKSIFWASAIILSSSLLLLLFYNLFRSYYPIFLSQPFCQKFASYRQQSTKKWKLLKKWFCNAILSGSFVKDFKKKAIF